MDDVSAGSGDGASVATPEFARQIIGRIHEQGVAARLLGGTAIGLRCPSARVGPLRRQYGDLDFATISSNAKALAAVLEGAGFEPSQRFNVAHGRSRLMFVHGDSGEHADVFIDSFEMCHELDLRERLTIDRDTLTLADLLLTKLQIASLNRKDVLDIAALLVDHELTSNDAGINIDYVEAVVGGDWGWWRTTGENLDRLLELGGRLDLSADAEAQLTTNGELLIRRLDECRKTRRWKMRARVGDRLPWREEPDEVA